MTDQEDLRKNADDAIKGLHNVGQTPTGPSWPGCSRAPTGSRAKTGGSCLMLTFGPEKAGAKADWRPVGQAAISKTGLVGLGQNPGRR